MGKLTFQKAEKRTAKLRLALFGPSGSGKTFTALRLATGLGGRVAVIDTERGSASKYADRFEFDVLDLPEYAVETYVEAIQGASGYDVLVIDSLTHGWHQLLDDVEKLARARYGGNTWAAWSQGTPRQRMLVDALLGFGGHVIATMRTKTEWTITEDPKTHKDKPVRIGLAPEQGKGIEYEFDLLGELSTEHTMTVIKDRTGKFQDQVIDLPGEELGRQLAAWLAEGSAAPAPRPAAIVSQSEPPVSLASSLATPLHADFPRQGFRKGDPLAKIVEIDGAGGRSFRAISFLAESTRPVNGAAAAVQKAAAYLIEHWAEVEAAYMPPPDLEAAPEEGARTVATDWTTTEQEKMAF